MIEIQNLTKIYKSGEVETVALKNVSFSVKKGEFLAIMGPSGSGKSTLMHILGCLDTPTEGEYLLDGENVSKLSDEELAEIRNKKIGFVFQFFNLLPRITVLQNVMLPLVYAGIERKKREELAKRALISAEFPEKFWNHFPNQLSGGMMQRVAIARALVNDPLILLADEPTGNLDSKTGEKILETFQKLNNEGRTIILVTHEKYIAEKAKRIIFLRDGEIVEDTEVSKSKELKKVKE